MQRQISTPAIDLLSKGKTSPTDVEEALEARVARDSTAVLRIDHPLLRHIRESSKIPLVQIRRKSRHILIEIDSKESTPVWMYREISPRHCRFTVRGRIPETILSILAGKRLESLASPITDGLSKCEIIDIIQAEYDWLDVSINPDWRSF